MGRRGDPRPGARFPVLGPALPALLCTTACDGPAGAGRSARPSPSKTSGSPSKTCDADLCTRLVAPWSREVLDGGTYGDYRSMGLSHGRYAIPRDVVDAARTMRRRQDAGGADELIGRQTCIACTERYRHGSPSGGPRQ
ncbi:hypothetical protein [Streptomyces fodineus]|uniref:hypothetical protein n=1 Tax=Streptomyces fodineus TaxID=1904616 RepID=UPI0009A10232|nr:hypothetical protein [Streptomyces fodineus]